MGSTAVATGNSPNSVQHGVADFDVILNADTSLGEYITATATHPKGDTSEFSAALRIDSGIVVREHQWQVHGTDASDWIQIVSRDKQWFATASFLPPDVQVAVPADQIRSIHVASNAGDDVVNVRLNNAAPELFQIETGAGNDRIDFGEQVGFNPQPEPPAVFHLLFDTGEGDDVVSARINSLVPDLVKIETGAGNDRIDFGEQVGFNPQPEPPAMFHFQLDSGAGDDVGSARFSENVTARNLQFDTGSGDDRLSVFEVLGAAKESASQARYLLAADTGTGDDLLFQGDLTMTVDGGEGNDQLTVQVLGGQVSQDQHVSILGGGGQDFIDHAILGLVVLGDGSLTVSGLGGDDQIEVILDAIFLSGGTYTVNVDAGAGRDTAKVAAGFDPASFGIFDALLFGNLDDDALSFTLNEMAQMTVDATADGGDGIDACSASPLVTVLNCEL